MTNTKMLQLVLNRVISIDKKVDNLDKKLEKQIKILLKPQKP